MFDSEAKRWHCDCKNGNHVHWITSDWCYLSTDGWAPLVFRVNTFLISRHYFRKWVVLLKTKTGLRMFDILCGTVRVLDSSLFKNYSTERFRGSWPICIVVISPVVNLHCWPQKDPDWVCKLGIVRSDTVIILFWCIREDVNEFSQLDSAIVCPNICW